MRPEKERTWWEGNQTRAWRLFVTAFIAMMAFISSWMFNSIDQARNNLSSLSDKYVTKQDFQCAVNRLEDAFNSRFSSLDQKVDDTNKYLRDRK